MKPWDGIISEEEQRAYNAAGFGRSSGIGQRPALLIIDVQYRTVGDRSRPIGEAIAQYKTSCGELGWRAVPRIAELLEIFRRRRWPVLYPHVAPKASYDRGSFENRVPGTMDVPPEGYHFVREVAPREGDVLLPKYHASAFFGTALASHLVKLQVDSLVFTGCTTSGCIRASVVDGCSLNFRALVPEDAVYDRSPTSHAVNLFDIAAKYADVMPTREAIAALEKIPT